MPDCRPRTFAATFVVSLLLATSAHAQAGLGHLGDASIAPRGMFRLHAVAAWTRYDARFASTGIVPLGAPFSADSFGVRQLPRLAAAESLVREASGVPFSLTLGRSRLDATAREEVFPLALEYGLTDRISVGVVVPFVRKRVAVQFRLDTAGGFTANAGPNRHRMDPGAAQNNATLQAQFASAAQQLQQRLSDCQANPAGPGCAALLPRTAEAQALIAESQTLAGELEALYGSLTNPGAAFVPTGGSAAQLGIEARILAIAARYRDLLSSGVDVITVLPFGAAGPAGVAQVQEYLFAEELRDTVATRERVGIGDIEVGLAMRVFSRAAAQPGGVGAHLTVAGGVRLPTGSDSVVSELVDMRLGDRTTGVHARATLDVSRARFGVLASGHYTQAFGGTDTATTVIFPTDQRLIELAVAPRWHVSGPLAVHGAYSLRTSDVTGSDQLVGGGISFSSLRSTPAGKTPPIEMRFTHLQSVSGAAGRPKFFRDQLELRIYYRLRR
jgi:hypothetical protein